jgi:hypothetical protein
MASYVHKAVKYLVILVLSILFWLILYDLGAVFTGRAGPGGIIAPLWYTILLTIVVLVIFIKSCKKVSRP